MAEKPGGGRWDASFSGGSPAIIVFLPCNCSFLYNNKNMG